MEVRGSVIKNINAYVKDTHPNDYNKWFEALSEASQELMNSSSTSKWYPIEEGILAPTETLSKLLYPSIKEAAWKSGRYSAEVGLTGIYKVFVLISTPAFMVKRASRVLATFYAPTQVHVVESSDKSMLVHFTQLPTKSECLEYRIAGWMEKALEICGCKELSLQTPKSIAKGDDVFEVKIDWK